MTSYYIDQRAVVETDHIGEGTRIWGFSHVMKEVKIGRECNIGEHVFIESGATVGDFVTVKNGNMLWSGVTLEDGVFVGPHVFFTNDLYPRSPRYDQANDRYKDGSWLATTLVKRGASLGAGAILVANTTIGEFAMIGAGAVVTKNVAPHALIVGNPGKQVGWVCMCGRKLLFSEDRASCQCGKKFTQQQNEIYLV